MKSGAFVILGLVLAGLVACSQAEVFSWGRCPTVEVKNDFDITALFGKNSLLSLNYVIIDNHFYQALTEKAPHYNISELNCSPEFCSIKYVFIIPL